MTQPRSTSTYANPPPLLHDLNLSALKLHIGDVRRQQSSRWRARHFGRGIVMPNLKPPIATTVAALAYKESILKALPLDCSFNPPMTLYLTGDTNPEEIKLASEMVEQNMPLLMGDAEFDMQPFFEALKMDLKGVDEGTVKESRCPTGKTALLRRATSTWSRTRLFRTLFSGFGMWSAARSS